jgi:predicted permease
MDEARDSRVTPLQDAIVGPIRPVLMAFAAAAAIVLLIACANIGTILIGRTLSRQRELAVRRALGASPRRLAASVLAESLLVAGIGTIAGLLLATLAVRAFSRLAEGLVPRLGSVSIDWRVWLFAAASAALASVAGALPALKAVRAGPPALRASGTGSRGLDRRVRGALVVTQIALAVVLLAGGALLVRTIAILLRADLGVAPHGTTVVPLRLTETTSFSASNRATVLDEILRRARALPGVTAAGAGNTLPPETSPIEVSFRFADDRGEKIYTMSAASVTPGYLPAIGARLLEGRDFTDADAHRDHPAVILSRSARAMMPPGAVVGREMPSTLPGLKQRGRPTVIGIVSDIKYTGLAEETRGALYVMWNEFPAGQMFLALRSGTGVPALAPAVRAIVRDADPRLPITQARALEDMVQQSVADRRLRAMLGGAVALLAFAVAMVGLAGTLMRMVLERRQEIAIRAALGATPRRVIRSIVAEGSTLAALGIAIGLATALIVGRSLRAFLFGVTPSDPVTLAGVVVVVAAATLLACYLPARRAARVDPLVLLRWE